MDCLIIGCGLSGIVIARTLAEQGKRVHIVERRGHIGGNIYDYRNEDGILVQKYGPHSFFTEHREVREYLEQFAPMQDSYLEYLTMINDQALPMPFNFKAIDMLYNREEAETLKSHLLKAFPGQETVPVAALVDHDDGVIAQYGQFMYENEYRLYTAKQWGRPIENVSSAIFGRVPVYLSYKKEYQPHEYQFIPVEGFSRLAERMLDHPNITYRLGQDALEYLSVQEQIHTLSWNGQRLRCPVVYTGSLDELFKFEYGELPYRSLEFIWKTLLVESAQSTPVVAWPQAEKVSRVTEYTKLPPQKAAGKTVVAIEIPFEYDRSKPFGNEPYYPISNDETLTLYEKYRRKAKQFPDLYLAGRLADYKYYNMDDAILRAQQVAAQVVEHFK